MRRCGWIGVMAVCVLLGRAGAGDDFSEAAKKELKLFEGNWQCTRSERVGNTEPETIVKGYRLAIEGTKIQTIWGGKALGGACNIIALDPKANPKTIDVEWSSGATKDQKQLGIYKLNKDKLEICWAQASEKKRPKKFTTKPGVGSGNLYSVYEREKE